MNNPGQNKEIDYLLFLLVEGCLDAKGFESIETWLSAGPQNREYYCNFVKDYAAMKMQVNAMLTPEENDGKTADIFDREAWHALAEMENDADIIKIDKKKIQKGTISQADEMVPQVKRNPVNKASLITAIVSIAALIAMIAFVNLFPKVSREPVATIVDAINARWENSNNQIIGQRLFTRSSLMNLQQGIVKIQFDNGAQVIMEAPSRFELIARDQMNLQSGKLYAVVPQEAIGFTVTTQMAKVIDLGTEFGVESDARGDTYLHVIKGKTTLIGGEISNKVSMEVGKGDAKKVSAANSAISDIPCDATFFVREINSKNNFVWKGQKTLNLADIVGGGNGFGTGQLDMGIDPLTGEPVKGQALPEVKTAANTYLSVSTSPYIDGVFIPNGKTKQMISSQGHIFEQCPGSSGSCYGSIITAIRILDPQTIQNATLSESMTVPCILMHANLGITYDLGAIRDLLPGVKIVRFQSRFGIEKEAIRPGSSNADFWILVDGKLRQKKTQVKEKTLFSVDLELSDNDRFLTLVTTDGGDPNDRKADDIVLTAIDSDWCMFADPVLVLE
jgi:hypothetical protein